MVDQWWLKAYSIIFWIKFQYCVEIREAHFPFLRREKEKTFETRFKRKTTTTTTQCLVSKQSCHHQVKSNISPRWEPSIRLRKISMFFKLFGIRASLGLNHELWVDFVYRPSLCVISRFFSCEKTVKTKSCCWCLVTSASLWQVQAYAWLVFCSGQSKWV